MYGKNVEFSVLIGREIAEVHGLEVGSHDVRFVLADGATYRMIHYGDCCETVNVEEIIGDVNDLLSAVVLDAREEVGDTDPDGYEVPEYRDSYTWTFYIIQTNKGAVTIRWLGESNGYYSESVDFEELPKPN